MFRNNKQNFGNNQPVFLSTQDQIRRANSVGSATTISSCPSTSSSGGPTAPMGLMPPTSVMMPTPASARSHVEIGGPYHQHSSNMMTDTSTPYSGSAPPPSMSSSCSPFEQQQPHRHMQVNQYVNAARGGNTTTFQPPSYAHSSSNQTHYYNGAMQQSYQQQQQQQPPVFHTYDGRPTSTIMGTSGTAGQEVIFSRKAVIPAGAIPLPLPRSGAVAPPPPLHAPELADDSLAGGWSLENRAPRRGSLESAEMSSVHSSSSNDNNKLKSESGVCDLNETYSRSAWTVTASGHNSAPTTTKTSPIMGAVPIQTESLWASTTSAPQTTLTTPNLSFRLDGLSSNTGKPFLPPPAAPVLRPKTHPKSVDDKKKPLLDFGVSNSVTATTAPSDTVTLPPQDGFQLPPALLTQALSRSCSPDPNTVPSSLVQTPKKESKVEAAANQQIIPGAIEVTDLESDFLTATQKELPAANWGKKKKDADEKTTTVDNVTEEDLLEEPTLFKTHRYRGPRHCRACRFHSKSLNSNVVVTRDLNQKYKVSLFCKVCNVQFEDCIDDALWQKKWDEHCKTQAHRRCALSSGPELRSRSSTSASTAASSTTVAARSLHATSSGNGGFVPAPRSQQAFNQPPVPSTPDRKTRAEEPTTVPQRPADRSLPGPSSTPATTTNSPIKYGIIGRTVADLEEDILSVNKKVSSWARLATDEAAEEEQEEVVYSSPFSF